MGSDFLPNSIRIPLMRTFPRMPGKNQEAITVQ